MQSKNKKTKSAMTFHLWRAFAMFSIAIMVVLWLLQVIFLNTFYESMKKNEIYKIGNEMVEKYNADSEEFFTNLENETIGRGIFAHIFLEDGSLLRTSQTVSEFQNKNEFTKRPAFFMRNSIRDFNSENWKRFLEKVNSSQSKTATYVISSRRNTKTMVYGAYLGKSVGQNIYLYINSPLQPVDATRVVLQNQLLIVSVISVLASLALAYFIARRFSKPIIKTSIFAKELAKGNYNVEFTAYDYKEISDLSSVLNQTARELGKTEQLRRDLMANVSHDLKTPLTIIKSYAEMIRDISGDIKEKRDAHTKVIIDESQRLSNLVNDILNLSKLQQGIESLSLKSFSLSATVKSAIEKFKIFEEQNGYELECNIEENINALGDEAKIVQVLNNLIINAINYSGESKKVSVFLTKTDKKALIEIKDYGEGISKEEISKVWERYYRTGKAHTREIAGTGIGLSIVKEILEAHKTSYGVLSNEGEGTSFWFELPISE
ncbi:MAG: HAMP domain-containing histidine kinase [Clostridia bacterium]|nr:HAMP domain-containing histidine kinase [Clostridia bacterium]